MNRRKFFKCIGLLATAATVAPSIIKNIGISNIPIKRKLKCVWTCEMEQDLQTFHEFDVEQTINVMMSRQIQREIDNELIIRLTS